MTKKYLIKEVSFPYDNYYFTDRPTLGTVLHTYDDKSEAEAKLSELMIKEFKFIVSEQAYNYDIFEGMGDEDNFNNVKSFYEKKTGNEPKPAHLNDAFELDLTDKEIVELMTISGISTYRLIEADQSFTGYLLWINRKNDYFKLYGCDEPAQFEDKYLDSIDEEVMCSIYEELNEYAPKGKISDLSEQPDLLKTYIDGSLDLFYYDENSSEIQSDFSTHVNFHFSVPSMFELHEINDLLTEKWFEFKEDNIT